MSYLKALLLAALSALAALVIAVPVQVWFENLSADRELERQMREQLAAGGGGVGAVSRDINLLPALLCSAAVFLVAFVWTVRRRRQTAASTE